jgi:hypothetical protein
VIGQGGTGRSVEQRSAKYIENGLAGSASVHSAPPIGHNPRP